MGGTHDLICRRADSRRQTPPQFEAVSVEREFGPGRRLDGRQCGNCLRIQSRRRLRTLQAAPRPRNNRATRDRGVRPKRSRDSRWQVDSLLGTRRSRRAVGDQTGTGNAGPCRRRAVPYAVHGQAWSLISCARSPSQTCALAEPSDDRKELIVSALDTLKGRGPELMRFALDPNDNNWLFDVSAAGDRIAVASSSAGPISIFSARGQPMQQINVKGWSILPEMTWAADGKSLYVFAGIHGGRMLLNIDLQGNTYPIWRTPGASAETLAKPSPDGRHLAVSSAATNGNMWMMENF